jgi:hypothetical protein
MHFDRRADGDAGTPDQLRRQPCPKDGMLIARRTAELRSFPEQPAKESIDATTIFLFVVGRLLAGSHFCRACRTEGKAERS